jgi:hypothetical protein
MDHQFRRRCSFAGRLGQLSLGGRLAQCWKGRVIVTPWFRPRQEAGVLRKQATSVSARRQRLMEAANAAAAADERHQEMLRRVQASIERSRQTLTKGQPNDATRTNRRPRHERE